MNHRRHEPQDTARALEPNQSRPILIEPLENLRMHRVSEFHLPDVIRLATLRRKLAGMFRVVIGERPHHQIALGECLLLRDRLEEPPSHDLVAFLRVGRAPLRCDPLEYVPQACHRFASATAADLLIAHPFRRRHPVTGRRGGNADHQQRTRNRLHLLAQRLGKGELGLEITTRQPPVIHELPRIRDPFIDQDQTGCRITDDTPQSIAGIGRRLVRLADLLVSLLSTELPCEFSPQRPNLDTAGLGVALARSQLIAHQHRALDGLRRSASDFSDHALHAREFLRRCARGKVKQRQHRVRLPAAEGRLQFHHRISAWLFPPAANRADDQFPQAGREKRPPEKLLRVTILGRCVALEHLPQVRRELRLLVVPARYIRVRRHHIPPRL